MRKLTQLIAIVLLTLPLLANSAPNNFYNAKIALKEHVYFDQNRNKGGTAYCGCDWEWVGRSGGRTDLKSCGYKIRSPQSKEAVARAQRTEWEHVFSVHAFAGQRQCWKQGGRKFCGNTDPIFNAMEGDMFNLLIINGEYNSDASNFPMGEVRGRDGMYGQCAAKVDFKARIMEPQDRAKGEVARISFYFSNHYGVQLSQDQQRLFMDWDKRFPISGFERERNKRIARIMGHNNPFVTGEKKWQLGMRLDGKGIRALNTKYPDFAEGQHSQQPTYQNRPHTQRANISNTAPATKQSSSGKVKGNSNSKIYHLDHCPNFKDVSERNSIYFKNEHEATSQGYRKARNCS